MAKIHTLSDYASLEFRPVIVHGALVARLQATNLMTIPEGDVVLDAVDPCVATQDFVALTVADDGDYRMAVETVGGASWRRNGHDNASVSAIHIPHGDGGITTLAMQVTADNKRHPPVGPVSIVVIIKRPAA